MVKTGKRRKASWPWLALILLAGSPAFAYGENTVEQREYVIYVDGKEAGRSQMSITNQDNGMTIMAAKASVRINRIIRPYTYEIQATEWWKEGRLVGLKVTSNDNGKRNDIVGGMDGNNLRLRVNALERIIRTEIWVNSFWKLADARFHNKQVQILDADTGQEHSAQLQYLGAEKTDVANQSVKCFHFRVTGLPNPVDLWFGEDHRLIRQEFVEQGHRTIVHLHNVKR